MRPKGIRPSPARLKGAWRMVVRGEELPEPGPTYALEASRLVLSQPSQWRRDLAGQALNCAYWVLHDGHSVVACALLQTYGRVRTDFPLFGYWCVYDVGSEMHAAKFPKFDPDSGEWARVRQPKNFTEDVLAYKRRNAADRYKASKTRSDYVMAKTSTKKSKAAAAEEDTKGKKGAKKEKEPKERQMTIARYLYTEVFPREVVGTDDEIIEEIREQDFCTEKWQDDDKSAKQQLAWYKNKYGKGEHAGADPNEEYSINQPYASNKKREAAEAKLAEAKNKKKKAQADDDDDEDDAPKAKKKAVKKAAPAKKAAKPTKKAKPADDDDEDEDDE